jgi:hypothetical protein
MRTSALKLDDLQQKVATSSLQPAWLFSVIGLQMHTAVSLARLLRGRNSNICGLQTGHWTLESGPIDTEALLYRLVVRYLATKVWWVYTP